MKRLILSIMAVAAGLSLNAQTAKDTDFPNPEAPVTVINLIEIPAEDIDRFVADWTERSKIAGQRPGYISATLYRSLLADAHYQLACITQWQSYNARATAGNDPKHVSGIRSTSGFYRPAAWSTNVYTETFQSHQPAIPKGEPLQRAQKDPEIKAPELPFMFINLMEMDAEDVTPFVTDWQVRSRLMGQMPAAMGSTLYRSVLAGNTYRIVNVSQWQSYDGFIAANNDPAYARELASDLGHTPSIRLTRGFYRPVASYTHTY